MEEEDIDAIDLILDYRPIHDDNNEEVKPMKDVEKIKDECEFLIKWVNRAYIHNTWETYESLKDLKGIKKLNNYIKNAEAEREYANELSPEELEQRNVNLEMQRELIDEYKIIERVIASREGIPTEEFPNPTVEYLCKWKGLSYAECTWEYAEVIKNISQTEIDNFNERNKNLCIPCRSAQYNRGRPTFQKLSSQPAYLVGGKLRDYQLEGLNWMAYSWSSYNNIILADEMGLVKNIFIHLMVG